MLKNSSWRVDIYMENPDNLIYKQFGLIEEVERTCSENSF